MKTKAALKNVKLICELSEKLKKELKYREAKMEHMGTYNAFTVNRCEDYNRMKKMFVKIPISDKEIKRSLMMIRKIALDTYKED